MEQERNYEDTEYVFSELGMAREKADIIALALASETLTQNVKDHLRKSGYEERIRLIALGETEAAACYDFLYTEPSDEYFYWMEREGLEEHFLAWDTDKLADYVDRLSVVAFHPECPAVIAKFEMSNLDTVLSVLEKKAQNLIEQAAKARMLIAAKRESMLAS